MPPERPTRRRRWWQSALLSLLPLVALELLLPHGVLAQGSRRTITLATTTSVRDTRLLEHLLPPFEKASGIGVRVIAVGSGQALELGRRGEADVLIVHDPVAERAFVGAGFGVARTPLMYNHFVLVGPRADPAGIRGMPVIEALRRIVAAARDPEGMGTFRFVSRADRSGTHTRELSLWQRAGVAPEWAWYRESGQGMSATLQIASELQAYALTDVGTFLSHAHLLDLTILVEGDGLDGDSLLLNPYHVLLPNSARFPRLDVEGGRRLLEYLTSSAIQERIRAFGRERFGRSLFTPSPR